MVIKLVSVRKGDHVHEKVFVGEEENQTFALTGSLVFNIGEWQEFGAALLLGAKQTNGRVKVIPIGDEKVCRS